VARGSYQRLSAQDSSFVMFEGPGTHMHVASVALFDALPARRGDGLDVERVRTYVESRLSGIPRYRQRLRFTPIQRHPVWVDDQRFNLLYHVRHTALPAPGSEDQLKELAGRILSQQLDREKPLWEMWLVEGLSGGRFAMISKVHHCMVDGASGVELLQALMTTSPGGNFGPAPPWKPRPAPGRWELAFEEVGRRLAAPASAWRALREGLRGPQRASEVVARDADAVWQALRAGLRQPANTPLNEPIGTHRRVDWRVLDLLEVKEVKKCLDGTVNDVVLAVVTGALRRFLRHRRIALEGLDFRIVIPVNMRTGAEDATSANRVSALFLSLPLAERDALRRFAVIRDRTRRLKESRAAEGIDLLTRFTDWTGSDLLTYWGTRLASTVRPYNMIVTNVPGPQLPLYLLEARQEVMVPHLPLFENQGVGVAVMSYCGRVCFGLIGDWDLAPDLPVFADAIDRSFAELREAALDRRDPAAS
jgi:diacylglycerol O-acyltransferase